MVCRCGAMSMPGAHRDRSGNRQEPSPCPVWLSCSPLTAHAPCFSCHMAGYSMCRADITQPSHMLNIIAGMQLYADRMQPSKPHMPLALPCSVGGWHAPSPSPVALGILLRCGGAAFEGASHLRCARSLILPNLQLHDRLAVLNVRTYGVNFNLLRAPATMHQALFTGIAYTPPMA
jgi:hypothetical protein